MAVTEQQFIEAYKGMDSSQQQKAYRAGNTQVKQWIDNYNASLNNQNNQNNYTPTQTSTQSYAQTQTGGNNLGNWNYGADTMERQEEIVNNLNQAYAQNPNQFSDWQTFANNFNYNYSGRSDKERETMRNWYENKMGTGMDYNNTDNTDYFFNQLLQGQQVGGTGAAVTAAMNRYKNYQSLSGMTPDQIASAVSSGAINGVGQEMIDLKNYSPTLYAQVQAQLQGKTQVDDINATGEGIYNGLTKTETNGNYTKYDFTTEYAKNASIIKQYNESLYKQIEGLGGDTAAYVAIVATMLQNPLIQANKDEIENLEGEINKINEQMYTIGDTARSVLGSEAPEDLVSAYISHQTKQLQNQLRTTQNSLLVAQGKLDNQLSEVESLIDALGMSGVGTGGSSDYQYVSGTKYQPAGYFNKRTGEFIPLSGSAGGTGGGTGGALGVGTGGGTGVDTNDYQDDSAARLKQIQSNLTSLAKTNPELFKDRATFNEYFKYMQRSPKQKEVLDAFWVNNKGTLSTGVRLAGTSGGEQETQTSSNSLVNAIKKDLINGTINFSSTSMKKTYGKYGTQAASWDEDITNDYLQEIGKISSVSELSSMLSHLSKESNKKALLSSLKSKVVSELKAITGEGKTQAKKDEDKKKKQNEVLKNYANKLGIDAKTLASRWGLLK